MRASTSGSSWMLTASLGASFLGRPIFAGRMTRSPSRISACSNQSRSRGGESSGSTHLLAAIRLFAGMALPHCHDAPSLMSPAPALRASPFATAALPIAASCRLALVAVEIMAQPPARIDMAEGFQRQRRFARKASFAEMLGRGLERPQQPGEENLVVRCCPGAAANDDGALDHSWEQRCPMIGLHG